jgi:hypothetical protein
MLSVRWVAVLMIAGVLVTTMARGDDAYERVQVVDPYLDLRTGPGRGYPVTQVVERGERIDILKRRTDWFKVRTREGKEGWVSRVQIEATVTEAGVRKSFRDTLLDNYLQRRLEVGFAGGVLASDPIMMARVGYRFNDNLTGEIIMGQVSGNFSSSTLYYVDVLSEPLPDWSVSPFFSLGLGRFRNSPSATLVGGVTTNSNMANAGLGLRTYLARRFLVRADYRRHVVFVDENRMNEYNELSLGIGFFFY